ncbi:hypothetical protein SAMN06265373_1124 [Shimia sagamensis]|uniref:Asparagine synthetase domain-containing protein n=2 Tax=Shimia sagamensis TaxID=1566352 RepID=A0ABY1PJN0_9RHOB|nr:hypothetical protein SAMN06265373_1124 [Shimia sagamensis]
MAGDELPMAFLLDKSGVLFAVFLGIGVDVEGLVEGDHHVKTLSVDQDSFFTDFESWLIDVAGRYTILVSARGETRAYTDPVGMNGMVYDPSSRQIASSTLLCLNRPIEDHPSYDHSVVEQGQGKYTLFHTRDAKVRRCNPNCYIDLGDFSEHRFWPRHETFETTDSNLAIYENLTSMTRHVIRNINAKYKTALPMSGGQDSRLLAVLAGSEIHNFDQIFTHIHNYASRIDATIASEIAKFLQVDISISDKRTTKVSKLKARQEQAEFQVAAGLITPQNREVELGLHHNVLEGAVVMRGHQTDLLRAVFIDRLGPKSRKNLKWQVKRLLIVPPREFSDEIYHRFLPEYEAWLDTLPETARERSVDFMFLEIYYSSTLGVTFPALTHNFFMSPFNSRRLIALSLSLDETYRRKSHVVNDMLLMGNPALHSIPFDYEFGGGRDLAQILDGAEMDEITAERRQSSYARMADLRATAEPSTT